MVHEIKEHIDHVLSCDMKDHTGEVSREEEEEELKRQGAQSNGDA